MRQTATQSHDEEYISMRELCKRLSISRSSIYRNGFLRFAVPIGAVWRFKWADVVTHLEQQKQRWATQRNE